MFVADLLGRHPKQLSRQTNEKVTLPEHRGRWHHASMGIQITIRDVPQKVRDELAARAAHQGKSMQEFLRNELERMAAKPTIDTWLGRVRRHKGASRSRLAAKDIIRQRDADRR
jgi:antitoxin FitA